MTDSEAIMWAVEKDPALRSDFCNLTMLERAPDEKRLRATVLRALDAIPRLRERVVSAPVRMVPPAFAVDPALDLDYHVRRVAVPAPGDTRALLDVCATLAETPFDRSRPLWEFTLLDGLADGRAAVLQKIHHTVSDGVGGLKLSLALLDFEPDPEPSGVAHGDEQPAAGGPRDTPVSVLRDATFDAARRGAGAARNIVHGTARVFMRPTELPGRARDAARMVGSVRRQAFVADSAHSDVLGDRSLRRHFEVGECSLPALRAAAARFGGSVNDAYITALAAGLGRYHARYGSGVPELRLAMPISTRGRGDAATNSFVPARVLVPIQPADNPRELFEAVRERLQHTKGEAVISAYEGLAGIAGLLPTAMLVAFTRNQARTIDFAASNLRGSPVPLYLAGQRIVGNYPFGPRTGTALNVTMLGYCDDLHLGFNIDPAAIVDIDGLMVDIADAFDALLE
jgi:WS/DGAT/MGAT family acyltransferase